MKEEGLSLALIAVLFFKALHTSAICFFSEVHPFITFTPV